ncbi:MAG: hypothetical protein ACI9WU_004540 [Myxococcota bacterium]|jgi:uncharacterized protein (TIGR00266 family)
MNVEVLYKPVHSLAKVTLQPGEKVEAEAGAMVGTTANVHMTTKAGGFKKGLKRMLGGESFFRNTFEAKGQPGEVLLAPALCGDMTTLDCAAHPWFVQSSSYVAGNPEVTLDTKLGGFKTFFAGEGIFVLRAHGPGQIIVGAFGALERVDLDGEIVIDTGHLVAWEDSPQLTYKVTRAGSGWIAAFLSGEGLICRFKGKGTIWIQTRNPAEYGNAVARLLPPRE